MIFTKGLPSIRNERCLNPLLWFFCIYALCVRGLKVLSDTTSPSFEVKVQLNVAGEWLLTSFSVLFLTFMAVEAYCSCVKLNHSRKRHVSRLGAEGVTGSCVVQ